MQRRRTSARGVQCGAADNVVSSYRAPDSSAVLSCALPGMGSKELAMRRVTTMVLVALIEQMPCTSCRAFLLWCLTQASDAAHPTAGRSLHCISCCNITTTVHACCS